MNDPKDITAYYARRASEYEKVYAKPERQQELAFLKQQLPQWFAGQQVLEVACGTGYWTQFIAKAARSITATDINEEVLDIARRKDYGKCGVEIVQADAYNLGAISGVFTAGFSGFWWSHVPKRARTPFLEAFHAKLSPGSPLVFLENLYVHGSNNPMAPEVDGEGNTYSLRRLEDGSEWKVLKNFQTEAELRQDLSPFATAIEYGAMKYYWWVKCRTIHRPPFAC